MRHTRKPDKQFVIIILVSILLLGISSLLSTVPYW